jgi:post-segregation antitoxin (ccd killing protein)
MDVEHQAILDRVAAGLNLSPLVDAGVREKWEKLREATANEERRERMAESLLITHHALL